jgi:hypothetical protein
MFSEKKKIFETSFLFRGLSFYGAGCTWNPPSCDRNCPPQSQVACKLTPFVPHLAPVPSLPKFRPLLGFPRSNMHLIGTTLQNPTHKITHTPLFAMAPIYYLHYYSLVLLMPRRVAPSPPMASMSMRATGSLPLPLGHHEYFLLRSSMLRAFLLGFSSSGSWSASFSIIWPTRSPTSSIAASIQLKGEMAS